MKLKIVDTNLEFDKTPLFKIGDIVKVSDYGDIYDYYSKAFKHFGIEYHHPLNYSIDWENHPKLSIEKLEREFLENTNWRIIDIALHCDKKTIIYYITTSRHIALIIGEDGIKTNKDYGN